MIIGLGVDITEVPRIRDVIGRHGERFLNRVFSPLEVAYCRRHKDPHDRFAARFAAKEAAMKALGSGWRRGVTWRQIEVVNLPSGKPTLRLSGKALEIYQRLGGSNLILSLTHTADQALAEVIIEGNAAAGAPVE
ncbi:MAG: holo-ACP synthase [Acidobacteria bacterium]|nr:holo-ACP synthase [Acidobacteriota bacterium]